MHVLGHSLSHRRKTSKPRDLHIRKVSFSGCSLSSGSSFSSSPSDSSTTSTSSSSLSYPSSTRISPSSRSASRDFDPLSSHPTFMPPPRLHKRPLLASVEHRIPDAPTSYFEDEETECGASPSDLYTLHKDSISMISGEPEVEPHHSLASQRPPILCSRWSDSTIASAVGTLSLDDSGSLDGDQDSLDERDDLEEPQEHDGRDVTPDGDDIIDGYYYLDQVQDGQHSLPNFSYKRSTLPKRPPIKTLDSLEDFIKRGGWKRRGIIFHCEEMDGDSGIADMSFCEQANRCIHVPVLPTTKHQGVRGLSGCVATTN